jgi:hypothetical protein
VAAGIVTGANELTISLNADSGGAPGAVIESFTVSGAMPSFGANSSGNLVTATSILQPVLTAGTDYWVVLSIPEDGTSWSAWNLNSTGDLGPLIMYSNGTPDLDETNTRVAMVITSAVLEPASVILLGGG